MRSVQIVCLFVLIFKFAKSDEDFVSKNEFNELRRIVDFLQKSYLDEKTKSENIQTQLVDLQRKYVKIEKRCGNFEYDLLKTKSRLDKVERNTKPYAIIQEGISNDGDGKQHSYNHTLGNTTEHTDRRYQHNDHKHTGMKKERKIGTKPVFKPQSLLRRQVDAAHSKIAFTARDLTDKQDLGYHQTLVFKIVVSNIGNRYHQPTGVFQCNVPGVYVFHYTTLAQPASGVNIALVKDGTDIAYAWHPGPSITHASNMAIIHLNSGDNVWIRMVSRQQTVTNSFGNGENSFSGFLLYADDM